MTQRRRVRVARARAGPRGRFAAAAFACALACAQGRQRSASADEGATFADRDGAEADETERNLAFMINPLAVAAGVFGGDVDWVLVRRVALSAEGAVFQLTDGDVSAALGVGLLVYPIRTTFHGLVLEPRAVYARPLREPLTRFDWTTNVVGVGGVAGWQWTWDYGLTVRLGAGVLKFFGGRHTPGIPVGAAGLDVVLDGSLGWVF